jgi:hypothetical protein
MGDIFVKPDEELVKQWYYWVSSLNQRQNPFHPNDDGQLCIVNNTNKAFWLAGVIGRTPSAKNTKNITDTADLNAIVAEISKEKAEYNDGEGNLAPSPPKVNTRTISIKDDKRDLYIPVSTEVATEKEYLALKGKSLSQLAERIIDREEDDNADPHVFVELDDGEQKHTLNTNQLKTGFRVNGTIEQLTLLEDNVFMLPPGNVPAAFSDYAVILKRDALKPGTNTLRFGVTDGKFFRYTVEYKIEA